MQWYTVPGWAAFVLVVALLLGFLAVFEDPTEDNEHLVKVGRQGREAAGGEDVPAAGRRLHRPSPALPPPQPEPADAAPEGPPSPDRMAKFRWFATWWLGLSFFSVFAGEVEGWWRGP